MPTSNLLFKNIKFTLDSSITSAIQSDEEKRRSFFVKNVIYSSTGGGGGGNTGGGGGGGGGGEEYKGGNVKPQKQSETIREVYVPALEKALPELPRGIKALMTAQTQMEGFYPGSLSYRTNNPGNVGTSREVAIKYGGNKFPTLEDGIKAQWTKVLKGALNNTSPYYKSNYSLYKYLSTYAPASDGNDPTAYTNTVLGLMKKQGIDITADTTLEEISKIN